MGDYGGGAQGAGFTLTRSDNVNKAGLLPTVGSTLTLPEIVYGFSGAMLSMSGGWSTGTTIIVEGMGFDQALQWKSVPYFRMDHGVWLQGEERLTGSIGSVGLQFWVPGPLLNLRVRRTAQAGPDNSCQVGWLAMHITPSLIEAPGKLDFQAMVDYQTPGNNVATLFQFHTVQLNANPNTSPPRTWTTPVTSFAVPNGKRLRIHSWQGDYLAGTGGGSCRVTLRSNLEGATTVLSQPLGMWAFGPTAGGTAADERWSGLSGTFAQPIDIYNPGTNASFGIAGQGTPGPTGKCNFSLFGYLVGN